MEEDRFVLLERQNQQTCRILREIEELQNACKEARGRVEEEQYELHRLEALLDRKKAEKERLGIKACNERQAWWDAANGKKCLSNKST